MPKRYTVTQGDCLLSIAAHEGFYWKTIWNDAANARLRRKRKDAAVIFQGDVVEIPDKRMKEETGQTEQRHRFVKKGTPAKLRLILERDDRPLANADYVLRVGATVIRGKTDQNGLLEAVIPPTAQKVLIEAEDLAYELDLGAMDPLDENIGVQARLQNLGFYSGELDGVLGPVSRAAIADFQSLMGLEASGELTSETRNRLFARQDREHEAVAEPESAPDSSAEDGAAGGEAGREDASDGDEGAEEQDWIEESDQASEEEEQEDNPQTGGGSSQSGR